LNKEYAIGAVGLKDMFVIPHENVTEFYIQNQVQKIRTRLHEMQKKFMGDKEPQDIEGKTVIIIDDGVATGNTLLATIEILKKQKPKKIVVAAPVVSRSAAHKLTKEADELISLLIPDSFYGVGVFYEDFSQVSDEEVLGYLRKLNEMKHAG